MNDLISRRKAFEYFVALWECIGIIMDRDEWEDACMTTANEIPSAEPTHSNDSNTLNTLDCVEKHEWIPCKERLPKIGQYVLRTVKGFSWNCEEYRTVDIGLYDTNDGSIIAWMPLPEPYRKEGEQE